MIQFYFVSVVSKNFENILQTVAKLTVYLNILIAPRG